MELEIPHSSVYRMLRQGVDMGIVQVRVWNVLRAPAAAAQNLSFSVWLQALSPHMAVKRANGVTAEVGEFQGERFASDTVREATTQQLAFAKATGDVAAYIVSPHMSVLMPLRRPNFVSALPFTGVGGPSEFTFQTDWEVPAFCGKSHRYVAAAYGFCSGSNRLIVSTNIARAINMTGFAFVNFKANDQMIGDATSTAINHNLSELMKGGVQWSNAKSQEKTIEIPHYRRTPLSYVHAPRAVVEPLPVYFPRVSIGLEAAAIAGGVVGMVQYLWHSVGDDFHLYFPIAVPLTRVANAVDVQADSRASGQRLVMSGDVELNPGPELGEFQGLGDGVGIAAANVVVGAMSPTLDSAQGCFEAMTSLANVAKGKIDNVEQMLAAKGAMVAQAAKDEAETFLTKAYGVLETVRDVLHSLLSIGESGLLRVIGIWKLIEMLTKYLKEDRFGITNKLKELGQKVGSFQIEASEWMQFLADNMTNMTVTVISLVLSKMGYKTSAKSEAMLMFTLREKSEKEGVVGRVCLFVTTVIDTLFEGTGLLSEYYETTNMEQTQFCKEYHELRLTSGWGQIQKVALLGKRAQRFKKMSATGFRLPVDVMRNVEAVNEQWFKLSAEARVPKRQTPTCYYLYGTSGQGKSYLQQKIMPVLFLRKAGLIQKSSDALAQTYAIPTVDVKHWEGYNGQYVANIDDAFTVQGPDDPLRIINLITPVDFTVPKANIEGKKDKFVSVAIGISSNYGNFSSITGINNYQAIARRVGEHAVEVTKRPGDLLEDIDSINDVKSLEEYVDKHWTLHRMKLSGSGCLVKGDRVCCSVYVDEIVATYEKLKAESDVFEQQFMVMQGSMGDPEVFIDASEECDIDKIIDAIEIDDTEGILECNKKFHIDALRGLNLVPAYGLSWQQALQARDGPHILGHFIPEDKRPVWSGLKNWAVAIGAAGAVVGLVYLAYRSFRSHIVGSLQGSMYDGRAVQKNPVRFKPRGLFQGVGATDKIRKCIRWIELFDLEDPSEGSRGMHCIVMEGRYILVPGHFYDTMLQLNKHGRVYGVRISRPDGRMLPVALDATNSVEVLSTAGKLDLRLFYAIGAPLAGTPRLSQLIPSLKDCKRTAGRDIACDILQGRDLPRETSTDIPVRIMAREQAIFEERIMLSCLKEQETRPGDCGRPYVDRDNCTPCPLVAIHSARFFRDKACGATQLVREEIMEAKDKLDRLVKDRQMPVEEDGSYEGDGFVPRGWFGDACIGKVALNGSDVCRFMPETTTKRRWLECQEWTDGFAPSAKGWVNGIHTLYTNASLKYQTNQLVNVSNQMMKTCVDFYARRVSCPDVTLTLEDAINGYDSMVPMEMSTSCGYWSKYFKDGKREVLDDTQDVIVFTSKAKTFVIPELGKTFVEHLSGCDQMLQNGQVPKFLWVSTNKDELRPVEKVAIGKTRVFEQPPLELSILLRKYFGVFLCEIKNNPGFVTHSSIGVDKEVVWKSMWTRLREMGPNGFDIDYSNYDGSVTPAAFDFFRAVTDRVLPEKEKLARHALLHAMQNAYLVCGSVMFRTYQGNKSGSPLTDVFNSVTNVFVMYLSYLHGRALNGLSIDLCHFDRDVRMITYGDDVIVSMASSVEKNFNRFVVQDVATLLGMKVTSASKEGQLLAWERLEDLSFIKLSFRGEGDVVFCPLPMETIWRMVQWTEKQNLGDRVLLKAIIGVAVRAMAHHGREAVERFRAQLSNLQYKVEFDYDDFYVDMLALQEGFEFPVISDAHG